MDLALLDDLIEYDSEKRVRKSFVNANGLTCELACYEPGQGSVIHYHPRQDEIFYVVEGKGTIIVDDVRHEVGPRMVMFVPSPARHGVIADMGTRLVLMFIKGPGKRVHEGPLNPA